jgi:signal transduction histidine kinase/ActR/RegA family two-component response regulator
MSDGTDQAHRPAGRSLAPDASQASGAWRNLPLVALLLVGALVVGGLVLLAARSQDRLAAEDSVALARSALRVEERGLTRLVTAYSYWGEAYANLVVTPDRGWAEDNLGAYLFQNLDISSSFVVDGDGRTRFAFRQGRQADLDLAAHTAGGLGVLAARARASASRPPVPEAGLLAIDGVIHAVAVARIASDQPDQAEAPGPPAVLIFARMLDAGLLARLAEDYGLARLRLLPAADAAAGPATLALTGPDGTLLGRLAWAAPGPGATIVEQLLAPLLAAVALIGLLALMISRQTERAHRDSRRRLSLQTTTLQAIDEGIVAVDGEGRLIAWNPTFLSMFGLPPQRLAIGQPYAVLPLRPRGGEGEGDGEREAVVPLPDGRIVERRRSALPDGGFVDAYRDVTRRQQAEEQLIAAKQHAEEASRAKTQFLATISHELRSPLHGVLSSLDLLRETGLQGEQLQIVGAAETSGTALLALIDDLLDLARLEAGRLEIAASPFELAPLLEALVGMLGFRARQKGLALAVRAAPGLAGWFKGDVNRIRQILVNLVGNAIKFTDAGEVTLSVAACDGGLRFEVRDTGPGIPEALRGGLFQEFSQLQPVAQRQSGSSGLGLAICRRLVAAMQGRIGYQPLERGSLFWFEVPLEPAAAERPAAAPPPRRSVADTRLLVVDDSATNLAITAALLRRIGYQVDTAASGRAAVEAARTTTYDLVLMDISMPEMDGIEATALIRALPGPASRVPVIAMTAHANAQDRDRFLAAGLDDYLGKPVRRDRLEAAIERWTARAPGPAAPAAGPQ